MKRTFSVCGMQSLHHIFLTSAMQTYSIFFGSVGCMVLVSMLFSCSSIPLTQREIPRGEEGAPPPRYSMVFIIHGDSDYLYHDTNGHAHRADEETLAAATRVAEQNPQAEVFIFHQKPRRHTLFFFPRHDGKFYYYKNGRPFAEESYWRDKRVSRFDPELELYNRFHSDEQTDLVRLFFYFGHEIPEFDGTGYDASYPKKAFRIPELADGMQRMTRDSTKFDLLVLSTCFGGTPHTIAALAPYARTIVASPDNLHLSYLDLWPFERLDPGLQKGDMAKFAKNFARQSFDRLTKELQTAVTVAVYDVDQVQNYLYAVDSVYNYTLATLKERKPESFAHCDCAEDSAYVLPGMSTGVNVLYNPPRFGRSKHKQNHSGWECFRLK